MKSNLLSQLYFGTVLGFALLPITLHAQNVQENTIDHLRNKQQEQRLRDQASEQRSNAAVRQMQAALNDFTNSHDMAVGIFTLINERKFAAVQQALAAYQLRPDADPSLVSFAQAALAENRGDYSEAALLYQKTIDYLPNFNRARLDLARVDYISFKNLKARQNFELVLSDKNLPENVRKSIQQVMQRIDEREKWKFQTSIGLQRNSNINQASEKGECFIAGMCLIATPAIASNGLTYEINANKRFSLHGHSGFEVRAFSFGDTYQNHKPYNATVANIAAAYSYKSVRNSFSVGPVLEWRREGAKPLYHAQGLNAEWNRSITPSWQVNVYGFYQKQQYVQHYASNNDGSVRFVSAGLTHYLNSNTGFFAYIDTLRRVVHERPTRSYQRNGLRAGVFHRFKSGLTTHVSFSNRISNYDAYASMWQAKRKDKAREVNLSISVPDWAIAKAVPSFSAKWSVVRSNATSYFSYRVSTIGLKFTRSW